MFLDGIAHGFSSGFDASQVVLWSSLRNMRSAIAHPIVIEEYYRGRVTVVIQAAWLARSPPPHDFYGLGPEALMTKFDVERAYRNVAMHPDERYVFGMRWRELFFIDLALPFGLRSAPLIFQFYHRHDRMDPDGQLLNQIFVALPRRLFFLSVLRVRLTVPTASLSPDMCFLVWAATSSVQVWRFHHGVDFPWRRAQFHHPDGSLLPRQVSSYVTTTLCMGVQEVVHASRTRVFSWFPPHVTKVVPPGRTFLRRLIDLLCAFGRHLTLFALTVNSVAIWPSC